jgi:hypothetical protein
MAAKHLVIQFQPNRASGLSPAEFRKLIALFGSRNRLRPRCAEGFDKGVYLNAWFTSSDLPLLWTRLKKALYSRTGSGQILKKSTIVTCEGEYGWDDYLLLHHYYRSYKLDRF